MQSDKTQVLIIDDSPEIVESLTVFLKQLDCKVFTAKNGEEGLALARIKNLSLILVDIVMPGMGGEEVLAKIKRIFPETPIIMITGYRDEDLAKKCMEIGAYDYITKPFDFEYLKTSVLSTLLCT